MCLEETDPQSLAEQACPCICRRKTVFVSSKKRIELLKRYWQELQERADDVKEYLEELEAPTSPKKENA